MKKLFTLLTLLVLLGGGKSWGADVTLFTTDFTDTDTWPNTTVFSQGNTTTADVINGITFYAKNSTKQFSLTAGTCLTWPNNNIAADNYFLAIPIENIENGTITVTVTWVAVTDKVPSVKYVVKDGDTDVSTPGSTGTQISGTSGGTTTAFTVSTLSNANKKAVVYLGRGSSNCTQITSITITTPEVAVPHKVTYKANGGTGDDVVDNSTTSIAGNTFTAPTDKMFWKWNTEADGSGTDYEVGSAPAADVTLYAQWAYEIFSMSNVTAPTDNVTTKTSSNVTATYNAGASAIVYNGKGSDITLVNGAKEIDLSGSNNSYFCPTFTVAIKEGDVITSSNTEAANTFKIDGDDNNSGASTITFPYTVPAASALIGKKSIYIFKNSGTTFSTFNILRPAVNPEFSLVSTAIALSESTQIQVGEEGDLAGITFNGDVTFGTPGIVTVNADGVVTAVAAGTTTINFNTNGAREFFASTGKSLSISVTAPVAPTITIAPASSSVAKNASVTLTATADGIPAPTIQWYSNTTNNNTSGSIIEGATEATYSPSTATVGTTYYYAIATNTAGATTSNVATVAVMEQVKAPTATPNNAFTSSISVEIVPVDASSSIKYSTDNGDTWLDYSAPINITADGTTTIKAKAVRSGYIDSEVVTTKYKKVASMATTTTVDGDASWDWTKESGNVTLNENSIPSNTTEEFNAADFDGTVFVDAEWSSDFNASALTISKAQNIVKSGSFQGTQVKFTTTVPGKIVVKFSNTGSSTRPYRYLNVNGVNTEYKSNTSESSGVITTGEISVPVGDVIIKGVIDPGCGESNAGQDNYLKIFYITFTAGADLVTMNEYEWATYVSDKALDFTGSNVKAYIVTGHSGSAITKSDALTTVPANTPLLLNAPEGNYAIPHVASSSTDVSANLLVAGDGSEINPSATQTAYVLSAEGGAAKFMKVGNSIKPTVPTGKAYLLFKEVIGGAREFLDIDIDGVSTGIKNMKVGSEDNVYYDLQGRRVLYPTKGLYIVNGKKVVIK